MTLLYGDVGGGGGYRDCRYPFFTFPLTNPFSGSICTNKLPLRRAHPTVINDEWYGNLVMLYRRLRPGLMGLFVFVFFTLWYKIFWFFWVSTPAPHVSSYVRTVCVCMCVSYVRTRATWSTYQHCVYMSYVIHIWGMRYLCMMIWLIFKCSMTHLQM